LKNSSGIYGGAIFSAVGALDIYNSTFANNSSSSFGGAIASNSDTSVTLENNTFVGNSSVTADAIYLAASTLNGEGNNLFSNNTGGDASFTLASSDVTSA